MHHGKIENLFANIEINPNYNFHKKIILLIIAILSIGLTACGYTREEKERMEEYKKQAEKNAIAYIEEKYHFTPTIEKLICDHIDPSPIPDFTPAPSGDVYVTANDGKRSFYIFITGTKESTSGKDNYQADIIKNDIEKYFDNVVKIEKKSISVSYGEYRKSDNKIPEYYDHTNLPELIEKYKFKIIIEYVDETFDELDDMWTNPSMKETVQLLENADIMLVSYRDEQAYESAKGHDYIINENPGLSNYEDLYIICVNEVAKIINHEIQHTEYPVEKIDDISYYVTDDYTLNVQKEDNNIDFSIKFSSFKYKCEKTYNTHSLISSAEKVLIFIPNDKIQHKKPEKNFFGIQYTENNEIKYKRLYGGTFGSYKYIIINPRHRNNIYLSLFYESDRFDLIPFPPLYCSKYTSSTEISAGDTPEILEACPTDTGL